MVELTSRQLEVIEGITRYVGDGARFEGEIENTIRVAGFAGTGKTTLLGHLASNPPHVPALIFAAPTNKAAKVLRSKLPKGADVRTLHKLTQRPEIDEATGELLGFLPSTPLPAGTLVIVDEASMVGAETWDIASTALWDCGVVLVGDPMQLPPVKQEPIFAEPFDVMLTEVHRQAAGSPVLQVATKIRETGQFNERWIAEHGIETLNADDVKTDEVAMDEVASGDAVILCFTNRSRVNYNRAVRKRMFGNAKAAPMVGDRIMFFAREAVKIGVTPRWNNGDMAELVEVEGTEYPGVYKALAKLDDGAEVEVTLHSDILNAEFPQSRLNEFDFHLRGLFACAGYAYALTVHKAQGSEWPVVYVYGRAKPMGMEGVRWVYTAITRASEELVWLE